MPLFSRLLLLLNAMLLASCQMAKPAGSAGAAELTAEQKRERQFTYNAQRAINRNASGLNVDHLAGSITLVFTLDRHENMVACHAGPLIKPVNSAPPYNPELARQMAGLCWSIVLPELPEEMRRSEDMEINAPLIFPQHDPSYYAQFAAREVNYATGIFFWKQTFSSEPLDSIGVAHFDVSATPEGVVQQCTVVLDPHPLRRRAFRQDDALVERLTERCMHIDLRQMPGFYVSGDGVIRADVYVEYTPWRHRL